MKINWILYDKSFLIEDKGLQQRISSFSVVLQKSVVNQNEDYALKHIKESFEIINSKLKNVNSLCVSKFEEVKIKYHVATKWKNTSVLKGLIEDLDTFRYLEQCKNKFKYDIYTLYADLFTELYNCQNNNIVTISNIEYLFKTQKYISKLMYDFILSGSSYSLLEKQQILNRYILMLLHLYRYDEAHSILIQYKSIYESEKNYNYFLMIVLDCIKKSTCVKSNILLEYLIVDQCNFVIENTSLLQSQLLSAHSIKLNIEKEIKLSKISYKDALKHRKGNSIQNKKSGNYEKFIFEKRWWLNEHSFFCNCDETKEDSLSIETLCLHTQSERAKEYEENIGNISGDFIIARRNFFDFMENRKSANSSINKYVNNSLIRNAFKSCYSILDQIGVGVLRSLNSDLYNRIKTNNTHVYFTNFWERKEILNDKIYTDNPFIISLRSLSMDLGNKSAYKSYKGIRNTIEHETLTILDNNSFYSNKSKTIGVSQFLEITNHLFTLTKSAILHYTYFLRRNTKLIEIGYDFTTNNPPMLLDGTCSLNND